jgi:hypothetical protein
MEVLAGFDTRHDTPPSHTPSPIFQHSSGAGDLDFTRAEDFVGRHGAGTFFGRVSPRSSGTGANQASLQML